MFDFSDCTRTGISISTSAADSFNIVTFKQFEFKIGIPAIFGTYRSLVGNETNGLPATAIGIDGATECPKPANMPSSDMLGDNALISIGDSVFSFGGRQRNHNGAHLGGSKSAFKYNLIIKNWAQISPMIHGRWLAAVATLSENEILIAGNSCQRFEIHW